MIFTEEKILSEAGIVKAIDLIATSSDGEVLCCDRVRLTGVAVVDRRQYEKIKAELVVVAQSVASE